MASEDDTNDDTYFEPVQDRPLRQETPQIGPPITADERMENLPELHKVFVHQFVEEANKEMEKIRNAKTLKKPIFTEANLREMAIGWTTTLAEMKDIPNINVESVKLWGKKFLPIIQKFSVNYEALMTDNEDRDIDKNHQNVIDLCSEDEEEDEEDDDEEEEDDDDDDDEYGMNGSDEEAILQAEQGSKYFQNAGKASSSKKQGQSSRTLSWAGQANSSKAASKKAAYGGNGFQFRGKSRRRFTGRRSGSSASGQSHARVTKRKVSGAAKKTTAAKAPSDFSQAFGYQGSGRGGGGGAGGGGGIRMMPT